MVLYGDKRKNFTERFVGAGDEESFDLWGEFGAIGRVHNSVKWLMGSAQRLQLFKEGGGKELKKLTRTTT